MEYRIHVSVVWDMYMCPCVRINGLEKKKKIVEAKRLSNKNNHRDRGGNAFASNPRITPDRKGSEDKVTNRGLRLSEKDGKGGRKKEIKWKDKLKYKKDR